MIYISIFYYISKRSRCSIYLIQKREITIECKNKNDDAQFGDFNVVVYNGNLRSIEHYYDVTTDSKTKAILKKITEVENISQSTIVL